MSERAVDTVESQGNSRERNQGRAAILDAARRVVARMGVDATSLGAVADDAGVARAAVYALFRSKNDLLLSIVADDMNLLAKTMREASGLPPYKPPTPKHIVRFDTAQMENFRKQADALHEHEAEADAAEAGEQATALGQLTNDEYADSDAGEDLAATEAATASLADALRTEPGQGSVAAETAAEQIGDAGTHGTGDRDASAALDREPELPLGDVPEAEPSFDSAKPLEQRLPSRNDRIRLVGKRGLASPELKETMKRLAPAHSAESEAQAETIAKLQETIAKLESGAADRLERRMQLLEKAVAELGSRHEKIEQQNTSVAGTTHDAIGKLVARLEGTEKSLRDSILKVMSEVRDAARRVDEMEFAHKSARREAELLAPSAEPAPEPKHDADVPTSDASPVEQGESAPHADVDAGEQNVPHSDTHDDTDEIRDDARDVEDEAPVVKDLRDEGRPANYLSAARRSAVSAAMMAEEVGAADGARKAKRTRNLVVGVGALVVVLVGAGVGLNRLSSMRHTTAQPLAPHAAAVHHVVHAKHAAPVKPILIKSASAAPLDKLTALANAGNAQAELLVGLKYASGEGIAKNDVEAAKWIMRSATQGEPVAQYWLGTLYEHGRGIAADPAQALAWYGRAAAQGNRKAMHNVAIAYAEGKGVAIDYMQAARWFSRAAALGYVDSEFNLAVLYERGDGVPQSLLDAYKWYAIAAAQGDTESKSRMDAIATQLSADDLAAAQKAAADFKAAPMNEAANDVPKESLLVAH